MNVVADALSRIHIDELKSIRSFKSQILAITRSKARQEQLMSKTVETTPKITEPSVYEMLNGTNKKFIPRLVTEVMDDKACVCVYKHTNKRSRPIIQIDVSVASNVRISLEKILSRLHQEAARHNITKIQMFSTDIFFKYFTVQEVQEAAAKILKNLKIIVTVPSKQVQDKQETNFF